ncbi:methyltransferase domain-containing protein [Sulfurovum sp.]|uniref:methyltransferase domain-containing protein n=1 Tax=Sulfurovum sp. TaxID=1969726 RepID=UPI003565E885
MQIYNERFYRKRHLRTNYSAEKILSCALQILPEVTSAIDLGCGVGTWLSVLQQKGIKRIQGVDGSWVSQEHLVIPKENFLEKNLDEKINLAERYDLAISLEVAEHLPADKASTFVDSLTQLSDMILFSAAIPYQVGKSHINCQWPEYWKEIFAKKGFILFDVIRGKIWDDSKIPVWYRQNIFLFVNKEQIPALNLPDSSPAPLAIVHPDTYLEMSEQYFTIKGTFHLFRRAVKKWLLCR